MWLAEFTGNEKWTEQRTREDFITTKVQETEKEPQRMWERKTPFLLSYSDKFLYSLKSQVWELVCPLCSPSA